MTETPDRLFAESEVETNRSCTRVAFWVTGILTAFFALGTTGWWYLSWRWMVYYMAAAVLPILAIALYSRARGCRGAEIKYLMVFASAYVPASASVPTVFGFMLMALPLAVACRYFSSRLVWFAYGLILALTAVTMAFHARYGVRITTLIPDNLDLMRAYLASGRYDRAFYYRGMMALCYPSFAVFMLLFALTSWRICVFHRRQLERQAEILRRLADVEAGLAVAATQYMMMSGEGRAGSEEGRAGSGEVPQPEAKGMSNEAIADCIKRCKRRAAEDPAFAALVERDSTAAVRYLGV